MTRIVKNGQTTRIIRVASDPSNNVVVQENTENIVDEVPSQPFKEESNVELTQDNISNNPNNDLTLDSEGKLLVITNEPNIAEDILDFVQKLDEGLV